MNKDVFLVNASKTCEISGFLFQRVINFLKLNGYRIKTAPRGCGTVIVNSCISVDARRRDAEELVDGHLGRGARVVLFGCLGAVPNKYRDREDVVLIGPKQLGDFNRHFGAGVPIEAVGAGELSCTALTPYQRSLRNKDRYVLISQGCLNHCTYCTIRKAKGRVASRPAGEILREAAAAAADGAKEVTLLSDECGCYGADAGTDLARLLRALADASPGLKFKLSTLYPGAFLKLFPRLKPLFAAGRISYVNIPLQSGSPRILKLMGRNYSVPKVLKAVEELRRISPRTWTYTHVIINFPTETAADFRSSMKASLHFSEAMYIDYSDNEGTPAARLTPKVPRAEGRRRLRLAKALLDKGRPGSLFPFDMDPEKNPI